EIAPVKRLLIERTDGNPFFLEESVRALVDGGALVGEPGRYRTTGVATPHVPATVEGVIASRIDRLPRAEKHLLQCASVIGRDVPLELLGALANLSKADLTVALHHLQQAEFVFEQVTARDPGDSFKHSLTHEVAYRSRLPGRAPRPARASPPPRAGRAPSGGCLSRGASTRAARTSDARSTCGWTCTSR